MNLVRYYYFINIYDANLNGAFELMKFMFFRFNVTKTL